MKTLALIATALFAITVYDAAAAQTSPSTVSIVKGDVACKQLNQPIQRCTACQGRGTVGGQTCVVCKGRGWR